MAKADQNDPECLREVHEILERFHRETSDSFMEFCETCYRSGIQIDRDEFIKLIMERMGHVFDGLRAEEKQNEEQNRPNSVDSNRKDNHDDADFIEIAEKLMEPTEPKAMNNKRQFIDMMQQYAAEIITKKISGDKKVIGVNVQGYGIDDDSLIVSFEMSSKNASGEVKQMKLPRGSKGAVKRTKKHGKKTKMTITALLERQTLDGMNQHVTITKTKSGSISINGVTIQAKEKCPSTEPNGSEPAATNVKQTGDPAGKSTEEIASNCSEFTEIVKYRCAHCQDVRNWIESFNAPKDVYMHWSSSHTDLPNSKPFQYLVIEYVVCFYCQTIGTYHELIKHHKDSHQADPFVIVSQKDGKKCALCSYSGSGMIAHFGSMHKLVLKTLSVRNVRSSVMNRQLNDTILTELLESKVHRKNKCGQCKGVFETENELRDHHQKFHRMIKLNIQEFYDNGYHLICNCCHVRVDRNLYLNHVENRAFHFKCGKCSFHTTDMLELVKHDKQAHSVRNSFEYRCMQLKNRLIRNYLKTQVIFGNGLVLTKQNLLHTKYDDSKQFDTFIDALVKIKKERHSLEITTIK